MRVETPKRNTVLNVAGLTAKQEAFCLAYIEQGNASKAYRTAYSTESMKPETVNRKASELMSNGKIRARIEELQAEHKERHKMTVDDLLAELDRALKLAEEKENPNAMISATMGKAKLLGFDKQTIDVKNAIADLPTKIIVNFSDEPE